MLGRHQDVCLPTVKFPTDWHVTYATNHWANEEITVDYIEKILVPFVTRKREALSLDPQHPALVIFDRFKCQCTSRILSLLDNNNIYLVIVPVIALIAYSLWTSV